MKKALAILLVMILAISVVPMAFATTVASGTMENITWKLDNDGTLTISGTGEMPSSGSEEDYPWYAYHSRVRSVVFEEGLTDVGGYAFDVVYENLETVSFSSTIEYIGAGAFEGSGLKSLILPGTVKRLSIWTFASCKNLETVVIEEGVEDISVESFASCPKLKSIVLPKSVGKVWQRAFAECSGLQDITILNKNCEIVEYADEDYPYYTIPLQTTIHGYSGSTAEAYAKQYNRTFVAIEENTTPANDYLSGLKTFFDSIIKMLKPMLDNLMNTLKQLFANTTTQPTEPTTQPAAETTQSPSLFANLLPLLTKAFSGILTLLQSASGQATQPTA